MPDMSKKHPIVKALFVFLIVIIVGLIGVRLALPSIIRNQANKKLAALPDYKGHIDDVDLALWRGYFSFDDFSLKHKADDLAVHIDSIGINVNWLHLFHKAIVCDLSVKNPIVKMVVARPTQAPEKVAKKGKEVEETVERKTGKSIPDVIADLIPFRVDRFELTNGVVFLRETDQHADKKERAPEVAPLLTELNVLVLNITNSSKLSDTLISSAAVTSKIAGDGHIKMDLKINPTAKQPQFNLALTVEKLDLATLNEFLEWQLGLHFKQGTFALYSEAEAAGGAFKGYLKPFIQDLKVTVPPEKDSLGQKIKRGAINISAKIFANSGTDNVATRIPFEGRFKDPDTNIWEAVIALLRNAFIEALKPSLDPGLKGKIED